MNELMDWFGDVFYFDKTITETKQGYTSERTYQGNGYVTVQLPYQETKTTITKSVNVQAVFSAVLVVLVFVTCVTWFRNLVK